MFRGDSCLLCWEILRVSNMPTKLQVLLIQNKIVICLWSNFKASHYPTISIRQTQTFATNQDFLFFHKVNQSRVLSFPKTWMKLVLCLRIKIWKTLFLLSECLWSSSDGKRKKRQIVPEELKFSCFIAHSLIHIKFLRRKMSISLTLTSKTI